MATVSLRPKVREPGRASSARHCYSERCLAAVTGRALDSWEKCLYMLTTPWPTAQPSGEFRGRHRLRRRALQRAWADFLGRFPWQWFVTLTFDPRRSFPVGHRHADREAFWWCGQVEHVLRRPVAWVYAPERGATGTWHVHALLLGIRTKRELRAPSVLWASRNGHFDARPVSCADGALLYTTKQAALAGEVVICDTLGSYRHLLTEGETVRLAPNE